MVGFYQDHPGNARTNIFFPHPFHGPHLHKMFPIWEFGSIMAGEALGQGKNRAQPRRLLLSYTASNLVHPFE
jgi:hypothetical protein